MGSSGCLSENTAAGFVTAHGDSAITMKLRVWCDAANYWTVNFAMWENVKKELDKAGIEIPYQYVNVIMKNP